MEVIIKFDPVGESNILAECLFLKKYSSKLNCISEYIMHDTESGRRYLVMKLIPYSVEEYLRSCGDNWIYNLPSLARQMLECIKQVHTN